MIMFVKSIIYTCVCRNLSPQAILIASDQAVMESSIIAHSHKDRTPITEDGIYFIVLVLVLQQPSLHRSHAYLSMTEQPHFTNKREIVTHTFYNSITTTKPSNNLFTCIYLPYYYSSTSYYLTCLSWKFEWTTSLVFNTMYYALVYGHTLYDIFVY